MCYALEASGSLAPSDDWSEELRPRRLQRGFSAEVCSCSVRFRLLSVEDQLAHRPSQPLQCAQLLMRHWRIQDAGKLDMEHVDGEGVIGEYPVLSAGMQIPSILACLHSCAQCSSFGLCTIVALEEMGEIHDIDGYLHQIHSCCRLQK